MRLALLLAQHLHRVDARRTARGDPARERRHGEQYEHGRDHDGRLDRAHAPTMLLISRPNAPTRPVSGRCVPSCVSSSADSVHARITGNVRIDSVERRSQSRQQHGRVADAAHEDGLFCKAEV